MLVIHEKYGKISRNEFCLYYMEFATGRKVWKTLKSFSFSIDYSIIIVLCLMLHYYVISGRKNKSIYQE